MSGTLRTLRPELAPVALVALLASCGDNQAGEDRQGGDTTVDDRSTVAYRHAAANLTKPQRSRFQAGRIPFDFPWRVPELGPLFNNPACLGCHAGNGRGTTLIGSGVLSQALIRVSLPDGTPDVPGGPVPVPRFGTQLQDHATVGEPEVTVAFAWIESEVAYGDGELVTLREPRFTVEAVTGDALPPETQYSFRIASPLIGVGLLEAVPESTLRALADPDDADGDGISGRLNVVWDPVQQASVVGRFGWKANTSTLDIQVAGAFAHDMGITSRVFPEPDGSHDASDEELADTVFYSSTIAVPAAAARDEDALRGRLLFDELGCASCHVPTLVTGTHAISALVEQRIHPYTDLLIHDLGDRLGDARPDFLASGSEWRTPPLWGIGLAQLILPGGTFLHDGRARTLAEAILWHGGEAIDAREAFRTASREVRAALLAFLATL
ncbi:MAG: thiol oxidoreductase [Myxococcales bacterium]|nr:thiol oxidoreductase [Myxococcales bacterium]